NPLRLLDCKDPKCAPIKTAAPQAVSYLCPACKSHFKEVLEYLEALGITYELDNTLVRGLDYYSRTVFELATTDEAGAEVIIGGGGRYDYLAKAIGSRREVPAAGGALGLDRLLALPQIEKLNPRIVKKPKVFFIQLSFEAKLKSLAVIEILRKAKIPLAQSLPKDSLGAQLAIAEKMQVPYAIILGQKEAIEESVIVRNMLTRSQDTVKINKLGEYLKNLK
ncbi:MAG: ATP phosphoribosyltransferase regulatory subunit, partial [Patescibacteria group bacterium]